MLDEVQILDCFEAVLNGYLRRDNMDIYVTGSNTVSAHYDEYGILICFIRLPLPDHRKIADGNGPHISTGLGNHEHTDHRHCISPEYHRNIETKTEDDRQPHISKLRVLVFFCAFIE